MDAKHLQLTDGVKKLLECPVCLDFFTPPVYSCPNGHSICSVCSERTSTCPECRASFSSKLQNLAVERMLEALEMSCRYPGCSATMSLARRRQHEESCEFNPSIECVVTDCTWVGKDLPAHLKSAHSAKEFQMKKAGGVRGWNSKTWKRADWGFGIWNFDGIVILNKSESTGEMFYLYMYDIDSKRHTLRLQVSCGRNRISFEVKTASARCIAQFQTLPFHLSIKEIEQHFLEPAEGLEEGYKRLSISVEMLD